MNGEGADAPREDLRRAAHAASGALGPIALALPGGAARAAFLGLAALALAVEAFRRGSPLVARAIRRAGSPFMRSREHTGLTGATTLACGYAAAWWLFPPAAAALAVAVGGLADPAAAVLGRRFGRGPGKTAAGSAACAATAGLVLAAGGASWPTVVVGSLAAALAERAPWRASDNILVPLAVGAVLAAARRP